MLCYKQTDVCPDGLCVFINYLHVSANTFDKIGTSGVTETSFYSSEYPKEMKREGVYRINSFSLPIESVT